VEITEYWYLYLNSKVMGKNTPESPGGGFKCFDENNVVNNRYEKASEEMRVDLQFLEEEDHRIVVLRNSIGEGIDSGIDLHFNPVKHLQELKSAIPHSRMDLKRRIHD
jgi:antitoxin ParD1/3/4